LVQSGVTSNVQVSASKRTQNHELFEIVKGNETVVELFLLYQVAHHQFIENHQLLASSHICVDVFKYH